MARSPRRPAASPLIVGAGAALSLGLAGVGLLGRQVVGPPLPLIAGLTLLPWLWLGLVAALAVWWAGTRDRTLAGLLGLAVATGAAVWGRAWLAAPTTLEGEDAVAVRVLSWNVQRLGWSDADGAAELVCVADAVRAVQPDVLALTEVSARDVARLERILNLSCVHADYRGTGRDDVGGLAACARGDRWRLGQRSPRRFAADIDWYYVFTEVVSLQSGAVFNLLAVHLQPHGLSPRGPEQVVHDHQVETEALLARMAGLQDPTLLAGDFNSARDAAIHARLRRTLVDTFEQAGWGPGRTVMVDDLLPLRIDYVYASRDFGVRHAGVLALDCADHRPVLADLRMPRSP